VLACEMMEAWGLQHQVKEAQPVLSQELALDCTGACALLASFKSVRAPRPPLTFVPRRGEVSNMWGGPIVLSIGRLRGWGGRRD